MKRLAAALLGASLLSAPANASDLFGGSTKDAPATTGQAYAFSWTGLYLGGVAGFGVGDAETEKRREEIEGRSGREHVGDTDIDGAIYGVHLGYNRQYGNIVFGVEGGIYGTELDTDGQNLFSSVAHETEVDWYGRVIARLGVTTGSTLFYGFGGVAFGDVTSTLSFGDNDTKLSDEQHIGWTAGAGLEHVIGRGWIGRVEYAHVDLGEEKSSLSSEQFGTYSVNQDIEWDQITVGLSYKF